MSKEIVIAILSPLVAGACYWLAVVVCEVMAARAATDGKKDWGDLFWPRMLKRISSTRYERMQKERC